MPHGLPLKHENWPAMDDDGNRQRFHLLMLPHLAAANNLAVWITGNPDIAADVLQESFVRALRFFDAFRGDNPRAWLLSIVRNTSLNWLEKTGRYKTVSLSDYGDGNSEDESDRGVGRDWADATVDIEKELIQKEASATLDQLIGALPVAYREVVVLREIEELSYKEIAAVTGLPVGTVMSRLARGRQRLHKAWTSLPENRRHDEL